MDTQNKDIPKIDIRKIFSTPIVLKDFCNHCPNEGCFSFDYHCIDNYERDGKQIYLFECNFCGACWEV